MTDRTKTICPPGLRSRGYKNLPVRGPVPPVATIENILITEQDVLDQLSNLNVNKPSGPDLTLKLLKQLSSSICKTLVKFFNKSLEPIKCLPFIRKQANVTPIFKGKGSEDIIHNYRPISLTSAICKIMVKIIFKYI